METLSFNPKNITKVLISGLNDRAKNIITQRYGLGEEADRKTLEEIGKKYGITRERVRQLVNYALGSVRKSKYYSLSESALGELKDTISKMGSILAEREILNRLSRDNQTRNHIHFLLILGDSFIKMKEDNFFYHRWTIDDEKAEKIHQLLHQVHSYFKEGVIMPEKEIIYLAQNYARNLLEEKIKEEIILSWLRISKLIDRNALGDWGKITSEYIRPRGIRDLAFLVFRKYGEPMHFNDAAKAIADTFNRNAHRATVHNELIKDDRFVLVGRGVYALSEWGYTPGTVSDVIKDILKKFSPLAKEEIIKRVLKARQVKENTILVNLQNTKNFKRNPDGTYKIV
ncbi:MAG: sigma factor-like helix-turn-helix DNA-binding protein [Patescibacteria group bacterium]